MKNLLTNDVMLTTTRVWLKITSPQKRAASYKIAASTQAHSVRHTPISFSIFGRVAQLVVLTLL